MINNIIKDFRFENPEYLIALLLIIPIRVYFFKLIKNENSLIKILKGEEYSIGNYNLAPINFILISLCLLIISISRPQYGYEIVKSQQEGFDVAILLDVSDSMLAEDSKPNRLSQAKRKIKDLIRYSNGNRLGLVSYAGSAFVETPLTLDYQALWINTENLGPELVPYPGSDLYSAIDFGYKVLNGKNNNEEQSSRSQILIVLSDGEFSPETLDQAVEKIKKDKIQVYFLILGSENGAPISKNGSFIRDDEDKLVVSRIDIEELKKKFDGTLSYIQRASATDQDIKEIVSNMDSSRLEKTKIESNNIKKWNEFFQIPLFISFILLIYSWAGARDWKTIILLFICINPNITNAEGSINIEGSTDIEGSTNIEGSADSNYRMGKYLEALEQYKDRDSVQPNSFENKLSLGNTFYRLGKFSEAEKEYSKAISISKNNKEKSKALFNRANSLLQLGQVKDSKKEYEESLKFNQDDKEVINNLEYVKKLLKEEEENNQQKEDNKDNSSENKEQKQENKEDQGEKKQEDNKQGEEKPGEENQDKGQNKEEDKGINNEGDKEQDKEEKKLSNKESEKKLSDKTLSQLGSIEESSSSKEQYRYKKILEELEQGKRRYLKQSW